MTGISLFLVLQLHHMDRSPYAAIAPVTLLWRPVPKERQSEQPVGLIPAEKRQVWVWVHAAAFDEALMCLQTACQRQVRHVV
jgi:ribonuclease P/MRP protein subunit POP1